MYKKLMLVLVAGLLMTQAVACTNKGSTKGSAVGNSTADSGQFESKNSSYFPGTAPIPADNGDKVEEEEYFYEPADLACVLPKGFQSYKGEEGMYVPKNYPRDDSTISYVISEDDGDITQMTAEEYKALQEEYFLTNFGDEVVLNITTYDRILIDKRPGVKIRLEYDFKGDTYEQLIYHVYNGGESHILVYTEKKDAGWMEKFQESGDTVHFVAR